MYALLRFLMMVFVSMVVWMAIGLGVGFVLHWVVPAINLGMATLIGVVTLGGCLLWLSRISTLDALYGHDDIEVSNATWSTTPRTETRAAHRKRSSTATILPSPPRVIAISIFSAARASWS